MRFVFVFCLWLLAGAAGPDKVLFDFESGTFQGWHVEGENPFGEKPFRAAEVVPKWRSDRNFSGWQGTYMVIAGDTRPAQVPSGKIISQRFTITHSYLKFWFGGEVHPRVRVSLVVDGQQLRTAFGNNSYDMRLRGWDVSELRGRTGRIAIENTSGVPSLMRLDHFHFSETPPPPIGAFDESRQESDVVRYGELKHVFAPEPGHYVAHASIVQGLDTKWHMYAQIGLLADQNKPENHKAIWHATASNLFGPWSKAERVLVADASAGESFLWQPFVMVHEERYWMFYVGSGVPWKGWDRNNDWRAKNFGKQSTQGPYGIHLATSVDGISWKRESNLPLFTDSPFAFTPFVVPLEHGWAMYYASAEPPSIKGKHAIVARTSSDLIQWQHRRVVLIDASENTPWPERSFFHSPVVFRRGRVWYLLAGPIDDNNQARLQYRKLFRSVDPMWWDVKKDLKGLFVDGSANLVANESATMFITHTGPHSGGVWIAPLLWKPLSAR
jgi:hypothetical protein